jgi:hypothetical protein
VRHLDQIRDVPAGVQKNKKKTPKSARKNRQRSQISGVESGMEVVGALPDVPKDSIKV